MKDKKTRDRREIIALVVPTALLSPLFLGLLYLAVLKEWVGSIWGIIILVVFGLVLLWFHDFLRELTRYVLRDSPSSRNAIPLFEIDKIQVPLEENPFAQRRKLADLGSTIALVLGALAIPFILFSQDLDRKLFPVFFPPAFMIFSLRLWENPALEKDQKRIISLGIAAAMLWVTGLAFSGYQPSSWDTDELGMLYFGPTYLLAAMPILFVSYRNSREIPSDASIPLLLWLIERPNPAIDRATRELGTRARKGQAGEIARNQGVELLVLQLKRLNCHAAGTLVALAEEGEREVVEKGLLRGLDCFAPTLRGISALTLGQVAGPELIPVLEGFLGDEEQIYGYGPWGKERSMSVGEAAKEAIGVMRTRNEENKAKSDAELESERTSKPRKIADKTVDAGSGEHEIPATPDP